MLDVVGSVRFVLYDTHRKGSSGYGMSIVYMVELFLSTSVLV